MRTILRTCCSVLALLSTTVAVAQKPVLQQLATAKILESQGDLVAAESLLRSALADASMTDRTAVSAQLAKLLLAQGRREELATKQGQVVQQDPVGDPVERVIRMLDLGSASPEVHVAITELQELGDLVMPQLVRAFPKLGPFGVKNSMDVFQGSEHAQVVKLLSEQIVSGRPEVVSAIAARVLDFGEKVKVAVARKMAVADLPDKHLLNALYVLLPTQETSAVCQDLLRRLRKADNPRTRASAVFAWLREVEGTTEDEALEAIAGLPDANAYDVAEGVSRDWVRVGLYGLRAGLAEQVSASRLQAYVQNFDWGRIPDQAVPLLLRIPESTTQKSRVPSVLAEIVASGYRLPVELDEAFCQFAVRVSKSQFRSDSVWYLFVNALPLDGEQRAIKAWQRYPAGRQQIVSASHGRPWFELLVHQLASFESSNRIPPKLFRRDWNKASPRALAALVAFAQKWPGLGHGDDGKWVHSFAAAFEECSAIPVQAALPLFLAGDDRMWSAMGRRDGRLVLVHARAMKQWTTKQAGKLSRLLKSLGKADDVPTAVRIMRMTVHTQDYSATFGFLSRYGRGSLDVVRLVQKPHSLDPSAQRLAVQAAEVAASHVDPENAAAMIAMLPDLPSSVVTRAGNRLRNIVGEAHVTALADALDRSLAMARPEAGAPILDDASGRLCVAVINLLGRTGSQAAVPHLRRVFASEVTDWVLSAASEAALAASGTSRRAMLAELLQSSNAHVVSPALVAEELRTDAELRTLARAAVLRHGAVESECSRLFNVLQGGQRLAMALAVLDDEDVLDFYSGLVRAALNCLAGTKDASYLPQLKRVSQHADKSVRLTVARLLGNTFVREAAPLLLEMLKDDESGVRSVAQKGLDQIANYLDEAERWEKRFSGR